MKVGEGYQIHMKTGTILTYPSGGMGKRHGNARAAITAPMPRHYLFTLNTGNNASVLAHHVTIQGQDVPDSSEIGAFDSKGKLVGGGTVMHGIVAFPVWGDNLRTKEKDGCGPSEKISFKLWDGKQECPLDFQSPTEPTYVANGIFIGAFSVPNRFFITKFALTNVYPNPFRGSIKIEFDVPAINGVAEHAVEINMYDLKGSLVCRLAKGNYKSGHYVVSWSGATGKGDRLGMNVYIVQMKANNFEKNLKLIRVR